MLNFLKSKLFLSGAVFGLILRCVCFEFFYSVETLWHLLQENAQKIAEFLVSHPRVKKVYYAGLPDHPGHDLHYSQVLSSDGLLRLVLQY